ncbi:uncharacterized protein F5Z01DRAFT_745808 [Emericellopsis atlantica]|uniref:Acyl-CoA oxidase n=1 Tax=Emericellopsis atlantica TaxID=2614577 RepID=A0A9P7ZEA5_9HYPO|nr:uncharacterized protein F5Z01DRAFT_745808 [Emericellopsis atlantica]KAG9249965.1 hypothetical protein F5Z01DRAFT_745808 [Emericellopsis atlantica]
MRVLLGHSKWAPAGQRGAMSQYFSHYETLLVTSKSTDIENGTLSERVALEHARARSICRASGLTLEDIRDLTDKFWDFHFDPIAARDMTAFIIATIHLNLCIGTLSHFVSSKPYFRNIVTRLLRFEACGEFMLTEIGHGLDARNLETTATMRQDGSFTLHSPSSSSAKAMPPTTPLCTMPRIAVVFARLLVYGEDRGVKTFLVQLTDGDSMCPGITSRPLPTRPGTRPLDHSITTFENVWLPADSLLSDPAKAVDERSSFLQQIRRVSVGTLSLSIMGVSALKAGAYIVTTYSQRRYVCEGPSRSPILAFSTQHRPILRAWTYSIILELYARWTVSNFMSLAGEASTRHAMAVIFKVAAMKAPVMLDDLSERCGWQGLFKHNQLKELSLTFQGNTVAEGDCLVLCIRLVSELLGRKYDIPEAQDTSSPLSVREASLRAYAAREVTRVGGYTAHRDRAFDQVINPLSRPLVEAIGERMAVEAGKYLGADPHVLQLFEYFCMERNIDWHVGNDITARSAFGDAMSQACSAALPLMLRSHQESRIKDYVYAPIVSEAGWGRFFSGLPVFEGPEEPVSTHRSRL